MSAPVVTSPARTTRSVVQRVSQATRESGSLARRASRTPSEIWSATLSGCPILTDSLVNNPLAMRSSVSDSDRKELRYLILCRRLGDQGILGSLAICLNGEIGFVPG